MSILGMSRRRAYYYDAELELRDRDAAAISATTAGTGLPLKVAANNVFKVVVDYSAIGATVNSSNNWVVNVQVSDELAGTYVTVASSGALSAPANQVEIPVSGLQAEYLEADPLFIRVQAVKTGSPGNLTYGAYITPVN